MYVVTFDTSCTSRSYLFDTIMPLTTLPLPKRTFDVFFDAFFDAFFDVFFLPPINFFELFFVDVFFPNRY